MKGVYESKRKLVTIISWSEVLNAVPHQHQEDGEAFQQVKMCYAVFCCHCCRILSCFSL